jgi:hypothetical protein
MVQGRGGVIVRQGGLLVPINCKGWRNQIGRKEQKKKKNKGNSATKHLKSFLPASFTSFGKSTRKQIVDIRARCGR